MVTSTVSLETFQETLLEQGLGQFAYTAIQKHLKKTIRYKSEVLSDRDPEPLHQMRVGLRRLRTTLRTYGFVVSLPEEANENSVKKFAKILGHVRDLDVLIQRLEQDYRPSLPPSEQHRLDKVLTKQEKYRQKHFSKVAKFLKGESFKEFKAAYKHWLKAPHYQSLASCSIRLVLPDLLLPLVSQLFLHPGWWVGHNFVEDGINAEVLNRWLDEEGRVLHDLRKQIKHVRYQAEFLSDFYGKGLTPAVQQFKLIQELLGQLQDCWVLNQVLQQEVGDNWQQKFPTLAQKLQEERYTLWEAWHPIQTQFLDPAYRDELRCILATPHQFAELNGSDTDSSTGHSNTRNSNAGNSSTGNSAIDNSAIDNSATDNHEVSPEQGELNTGD